MWSQLIQAHSRTQLLFILLFIYILVYIIGLYSSKFILIIITIVISDNFVHIN